MASLALTSEDWAGLEHRSGVAGHPTLVPDGLGHLVEHPDDLDAFGELWPQLCSEGTTWPAAFAAAPYLVELARFAKPESASQYLIVLGLFATYAGEPPGDLADAYAAAVIDALPQVTEALRTCRSDETLRYLLGSVAALRGRTELAALLQDVDAVTGECPECGADVYPAELQRVVEEDARRRDYLIEAT